MKTQYKVLLLAFSIAGFVRGQSQDLPACAQTALSSSVSSSGCSSIDTTCLCSDSSYVTSVENQLATNCSQDDLQSKPTLLTR
jgi:hypothetical protein